MKPVIWPMARPVGLLGVCLALWACSENDLPGADASVKKDSLINDLKTDDRSVSIDSVGTPDRSPALDRSPVPDRSPAPDRLTAPDRGPRPDLPPLPSCSGISCKLANDCCNCKAYNPATTKAPTCSITTCKQLTCGGLGIRSPMAYCVKDRCLVADTGTRCTSDKECKLVNTCCDCLALPTAAMAPTCPITSCFVPHCTAISIASARAKCIGGVCRVQP